MTTDEKAEAARALVAAAGPKKAWTGARRSRGEYGNGRNRSRMGDGDYMGGQSYGYGYGYGSGYGYGDGYGYGYGYGYGSGDGSGSGYDAKEQYLKAILPASEDGWVSAFWRSDDTGRPCNGGESPPVTEGLLQELSGTLHICTEHGLHATNDPSKWKGKRWWIVALKEPAQRQEDKLASLQRKIIKDLGRCPF